MPFSFPEQGVFLIMDGEGPFQIDTETLGSRPLMAWTTGIVGGCVLFFGVIIKIYQVNVDRKKE